MDLFRRFFYIIKIYPAILYSVALIVFLPLFLYFYTFYITSKFQQNIDFILQNKASFLANILSLFSQEYFDSPNILKEKIQKILKNNPELKKVRILKREGESFKIIAGSEETEIGAILEGEISADLAWSQNQTIVTPDAIGKERLWKVILPIQDEKGNKIGLISLALSLKPTDEIISRSIFLSFFFCIFGILISLFLVLQHMNLLGYLELAKKLQETDKAKDEFIRMATHELFTPIVNIRNYFLELKEKIKEKLTSEEKIDFERIEKSSNNLINLINDILEVSRIQQGRLDFTPQEIDPEKEISQIISEFQQRAKEKGLDLIFIPQKEKVILKVNPIRFREIIINLLSNAIKYTFSGYVKVGTKVDFIKKKYYIFFIDTGIGISAEAQKKLFQKFFRERKKETADVPGTGLGLWISQEIARKMGGEILVESIEGRGSKFIVVLPLKV